MRLIVARCEVVYSGRLNATLPEAVRLLIHRSLCVRIPPVRAFLAGALLVAALGVAGCGGGSSPGGSTNAAPNGEAAKPAQQVLADAVKAAKNATAVHMSGYLVGLRPNPMDVTFERGKGAIGTLTAEGRFKVDIVVIGDPTGTRPNGKLYMRGSSGFWAYNGPAAGITDPSRLNGKWLEVSPSDYAAFAVLGGWADNANVDAILGQLTTHMGALTKEVTTYKGQSVVAIYGTSKIRKVYVAATGTPYPVLAAVKGPTPASVSFDNWGKSVSLSAPSGAIDVSTLGG